MMFLLAHFSFMICCVERNRFEKCTKSSSHHNNHYDSCRILDDEVGAENHRVLHVVGMKKFVVSLQNYFLKNRTSAADYSLLLLEAILLPPAVALKLKKEAPMVMTMVTVLPISIVLIACS